MEKTVIPLPRFQKKAGCIPLSFGQERLWFIDQLEGSTQYHLPVLIRLNGRLDKDALEHALKAIVNRHQVLRTILLEKEGEVYQQTMPKDLFQLDYIDGFADDDAPDILQKNIQQLINKPFDLSKDHLIRAALINIDREEYILLLITHRIASDDWSVSIMINELVELYAAHNEGRPSTLTPLEIQYADYSDWQKNYLQGEILDGKLEYWKQKLYKLAPIDLPTDYLRPKIQSKHGNSVRFNINQLLLSQLQQLSSQQGVTIQLILLAAFKVLLFRYSGQQDICVGTPVTGRQKQAFDGLIGFFENTISLRSQVDGDVLFEQLLQQLKTTVQEAIQHQDTPFEKVVECIVKERNLGRNPLLQVMFVFRNATENIVSNLGEIALSRESYQNTTTLSDVTLYITEMDKGMRCSIEYSTDLYMEATVNRMVVHFQNLLGSIVKVPSQKISLLPMLSEAEKHQLLVDLNNTATAYPKNKTIIDLFEEQAFKTPDAVAVIFEKEHLTYKELNERSNQFARYLQSKGVKEETLVPLCIERSHQMIIAILGVLKAGGAYVPIDPEYPEKRISLMLEETESTLLVTSKYSKSKISTASKLDMIELDTHWAIIKQQQLGNLQTNIKPHHLAYVIYTSGSTGIPKGVMITHANTYSFICWCRDEFSSSLFEIVYAGTSICFDLSIYEIFYPISIGKRLRVIENGMYIEKYLLNERQVLINCVPAVVQHLLKEGVNLRNISVMNMAGEPIPASVLQELDAEKMEIRNLYGPTEDTTYSTVFRLKKGEAVSIGRPISNTQIYIVNKEMMLVPPGIAGEICIGGNGIARGYLKRAELTAQKFVANPFSNISGERLYKTGDLGRWLPDGNIGYLGRLDDQVKIRGYRIELGEIETVLQQCEMVNESVVLAKQDKEGNKRLVAYVAPDWKSVKMKERELYLRQVDNWKGLYETEYEKTEQNESINQEFNIIGWNDSFTGMPITADHMKDWLNDIIKLIFSGNATHVLEIGCGTGLIYYQLAGKVKKYIGTDFSGSSIRQIQHRIKKALRDYGPTELQVSAAHEVLIAPSEEIDTVLINSVVQYFPGEDYLTDVIKKSIVFLKGNGRIIIGDVRDNRLLRLFKSRLMIQKLQQSLSVKEFKWAVNQEMIKEEELCFSPDYFYGLSDILPQISHVEIQWKQSDFINELSLYRYNVIIYVGNEKELVEPKWKNWNESEAGEILTQLHRKTSQIIALKDVPNHRLFQEQFLNHALENHSAATVADLVLAMQQQNNGKILITEILETAIANDYDYRLLVHEDPLKQNLLIEPKASGNLIKQNYYKRIIENNTFNTNIPLFAEISYLLQKDIRALILQRLPEYMVPSEIISLSQLPLTLNGKVDRTFLSQREERNQGNKLNYAPPHSQKEQELATIWQSMLGIERIGMHDNFFDMGGHSLLAMRLISAINKKLEIELTINDLFINQTIGELAAYIHGQTNKAFSDENSFSSLLQIKKGKRTTPLYMVCGDGGTVFKFKEFADMLDEHQAVYGLQQPVAINNLKEFPDTIEGIAERYIKEILLQNPIGPYALSGHCLGGIIAFEMAKQLVALGKEVKLLALFDTVLEEGAMQEAPSFSNFYHIPLNVKKYSSNLILKVYFQTFLLMKYTKYTIGNKINKLKTLTLSNDNQNNTLDVGLKVFKKLEENFIRAQKNYQITHFDKDIVLFYAKEHYYFWDNDNNVRFKSYQLDDETKNMWKRYVRSITIHEIDGDHSTIFYPTNAKGFAQLMQQHLNKCNED